jgi:hypothetical protein
MGLAFETAQIEMTSPSVADPVELPILLVRQPDSLSVAIQSPNQKGQTIVATSPLPLRHARDEPPTAATRKHFLVPLEVRPFQRQRTNENRDANDRSVERESYPMNRAEKPRLDNPQAASRNLDFGANRARAETVWPVAAQAARPQAFFPPVAERERVRQDELERLKRHRSVSLQVAAGRALRERLLVLVSAAEDSRELALTPPKSRNSLRQIPVSPALAKGTYHDEHHEHASASQKSRAPFGSMSARASCEDQRQQDARTGDDHGQAMHSAFDFHSRAARIPVIVVVVQAQHRPMTNTPIRITADVEVFDNATRICGFAFCHRKKEPT